MINIEKIEIAKKIYEKLPRWKFANDILTSYFEDNLEDFSEKTTFIKVSLIDSLYKTNLKDQINLSQHISKLPKLKQAFSFGESNIVDKIARCGDKNLLSFASKFAHFHNKEEFSIYDKYVVIALSKLITWKDDRTYINFIKGVERFREENKLDSASFEELDQFLWLYGMMIRISKGKRDINKELISAYENNKEMFNSLLV